MLYFALLSNLLLASAALAASTNFWPGAIINKPDGTFSCVSGTFSAPAPPTEGSDGTITVWLGMDGTTCPNSASVFQGGITTTITSGVIKYDCWATWNPGKPYHFTNLTVVPGDTMTINVLRKSSTSGTVFIKNEDTGQLAWKGFDMDSSFAICGASAQWVVDTDGPVSALANVGGVVIIRAFASGLGSDHVYMPYNNQDGATLHNMTQDGTLVMATLIADDQESLGVIQAVLLE